MSLDFLDLWVPLALWAHLERRDLQGRLDFLGHHQKSSIFLCQDHLVHLDPLDLLVWYVSSFNFEIAML